MTASLQSARLVLDAPEDSDIDTIFELCQDTEIHRWVPLPWPYTRQSAEFFVRSYVPHGLISGAYETWAIRTADDRAFIGAIELRKDVAERSASFGCWVGAPSRGRGFMREAASAVIAYGTSESGPGYQRLRWEGLVGNDSSRRLATSLGFVMDDAADLTLDFHGERRPGWRAVLSVTDRVDGR